jgi:HEAT repeat protein
MASGDSSYFKEGVPSIGAIETRRRIVRDFLCSVRNAADDVTTFHSFEPIINQIGLQEFQWSVVELLNDEDEDVRLNAACLLLEMEHEIPKAERTLLEQLEGTDVKASFRTAILLSTATRIPDAIYPALLTLFKSKNWFCRVAAATVLADRSVEAYSVLRQALRGSDPSAVAAATADWNRGQKNDPADLHAAKSYMTEMLRNISATALGRRGINCKEAVDTLVQGVEHGPSDAKVRNVYLLLRLGPQAKAALPTLIRLLEKRHTDGNLRQSIASAIACR